MHTVFALLCFVEVIHWLIFLYPSGLLHWHCGNLTIAPVPAKQPWWIWINTSCEFIMNDCVTITKQSTTKPCAYFLGYTVRQESLVGYAMTTIHSPLRKSYCHEHYNGENVIFQCGVQCFFSLFRWHSTNGTTTRKGTMSHSLPYVKSERKRACWKGNAKWSIPWYAKPPRFCNKGDTYKSNHGKILFQIILC